MSILQVEGQTETTAHIFIKCICSSFAVCNQQRNEWMNFFYFEEKITRKKLWTLGYFLIMSFSWQPVNTSRFVYNLLVRNTQRGLAVRNSCNVIRPTLKKHANMQQAKNAVLHIQETSLFLTIQLISKLFCRATCFYLNVLQTIHYNNIIRIFLRAHGFSKRTRKYETEKGKAKKN